MSYLQIEQVLSNQFRFEVMFFFSFETLPETDLWLLFCSTNCSKLPYFHVLIQFLLEINFFYQHINDLDTESNCNTEMSCGFSSEILIILFLE